MKTTTLLPFLTSIVTASPFLFASKDGDQKPITPSPPSSNPIASIPPLGLGLWNSKADLATDSVLSAFEADYTHLDGAAAYDNEPYVGMALSNSSAPARSSYWLTSKLWNTHHRPTLVPLAFNKTLTDLNTTYLDLYLMHWPVAFLPNTTPGRTILDQDTTITDTWRAMETLASAYRASGGAYGARYIGVSNFSPRQLDQILSMCTICPYAHEFETHPYLQQQEFVSWHQRHDIKVIAYSPLANLNPTYKDVAPGLPPILEDKFWVEFAAEKNVTVAQAVLGWGIARGTVVIPKSTHGTRIRENFGALKAATKFTRKDLEKVAREDKKVRFNNPSKSWGVELFEGLDAGSNRFVMGGGGCEWEM